jgi:hypothetical protein
MILLSIVVDAIDQTEIAVPQQWKNRSTAGLDRHDYFSTLNYDCDAIIATIIPMPIIQIN